MLIPAYQGIAANRLTGLSILDEGVRPVASARSLRRAERYVAAMRRAPSRRAR